MRTTFGAVASVIAAVIVAVVAVAVISGKSNVPSAGQTPGYSQVPLTGAAPSTPTSSGSASSSSYTLPAGSSIAFVGDNYVLGAGASSPAKGFAAQVAGALKASYQTFGSNGGGYAKPGTDGKAYTALVDAVAAAKPSVVIVTGGRNDKGDDLNTARSAITSFFSQLSAKVSGARLIAVRPFWGDSDAPGVITQIAGIIHTAVKAAGGQYVNLDDPLHGHADYMADAANPNDKGYAAITAALLAALRSVLAKGGSSTAATASSS